LLTAIVALGFPAGQARAQTDDPLIAVPGGDKPQLNGGTASFAGKTVSVGALVLTTELHLSGTGASTYRPKATPTTQAKLTARPLTKPAGALSKVHGHADPVLSYVLGDIGRIAAEAKPRSAEALACSTTAALSMSAVENMRLLDFMGTVAGKAGMRIVDKGIGNIRITGDAFSGIALTDLLKEASGDGHFLAAIKGCSLVLSPVLPSKLVTHAQADTGQQSLRRQETDIANLVLSIAEKSGRSVTMIGEPVPLHAILDGAADMDAQALASAINHAAAGVLRVTVKDETIVLQYLTAAAAASSDAQERFRDQGRFLVLPALELSQKAAKKPPAKGNNI